MEPITLKWTIMNRALCSGMSLLEQGGWLRWTHQCSLPTLPILWFCDSTLDLLPLFGCVCYLSCSGQFCFHNFLHQVFSIKLLCPGFQWLWEQARRWPKAGRHHWVDGIWNMGIATNLLRPFKEKPISSLICHSVAPEQCWMKTSPNLPWICAGWALLVNLPLVKANEPVGAAETAK